MEKLEAIRTAHVIEHELGSLAATVADEALRKRKKIIAEEDHCRAS